VLEVSLARTSGVEEFLVVSDAIAVGVAVFIDIVGVRLLHEEAVAQREQDAWQHEAVDEHRVAIKDAVALRRPVHRDAADGGFLVRRVDIFHVGTHLGYKHAAIAIEGSDHWLRDERLTQDQFEVIARRQFKEFQALVRGQIRWRWHRREARGLGGLGRTNEGEGEGEERGRA
jgi:hypothetical protein